jgi:hypothetical protein
MVGLDVLVRLEEEKRGGREIDSMYIEDAIPSFYDLAHIISLSCRETRCACCAVSVDVVVMQVYALQPLCVD